MTKKILSFLCALALLVSTTAFGTFSASAANATTKFIGFDKATCTLPDNLNWNSSGSGFFKTECLGDGLLIAGSNIDLKLTAELGTYSINDYFKADFDLWYRHLASNENPERGVEGNENWHIAFGDLVITFTRTPAAAMEEKSKNLYLKSVTYKGQEVALTGNKNFSKDTVKSYEYTDQFWLDSRQQINTFLDENMVRVSWMLMTNQFFWPQANLGVEVTYDSGTLTIKNTTGTTTNTVTADLTAVSGFNASNAFKTTKITATLDNIKSRGTFATVISDFNGVCDGTVVKLPESQSGSGSGSTSSQASNSSKPTQNSSATSSKAPTSSAQPQSSSAAESSKATASSKDSTLAGTTDTDNDLIIEDKPSNALTIIIIVVAACVVVAGAVVAFILLRKKNTKVEEEPTEEQGE